jgi:glyoxylase-like metal-dependent hydrolase (beta-lactamase superfamily II)
MRSFLGFDRWPESNVQLDLGDRTIHVIPAPGHHPDHVVFYDERTGLLLTGDFLLPGRLLIDDIAAYRKSAARVVDFVRERPLTHVLGGHIELNAKGELYAHGSTVHHDERPLELTKDDLLALVPALAGFNGFHARHANFVLTHPIHNLLLLGSATLAIGALVVWGLRGVLRRRRQRRITFAQP